MKPLLPLPMSLLPDFSHSPPRTHRHTRTQIQVHATEPGTHSLHTLVCFPRPTSFSPDSVLPQKDALSRALRN